MTDNQFGYKKRTLLALCPRKNMYFCDGTPNKSVLKGKQESLGKCEHRKNGKCQLLEKYYEQKWN